MPSINPGKFSSQDIVEIGREKYAVSQRDILRIRDIQRSGIKFSTALRLHAGIDGVSRVQYL